MWQLQRGIVVGRSALDATPAGSSSPVTLNAVSTAAQGAASSATFSNVTHLTIASGANRALLVIMNMAGQSSTGISVTWAGVAMTQIGSTVNAAGGYGRILLWGLLAPATGLNTLAATWTGATANTFFGIAFNDVNQTNLATAFPNFTSSTSTGSVVVTSSTLSAVVGAFTAAGTATSTNETQAFVENSYVSSAGNYAVPAAASKTMTLTGTAAMCAAGVSVAPV